MPHTHTEPGQYDPTVTAMVVRYDGVPRVLLPLHRKYGVRLPPGGHIELDENPWQAVSRELLEETGYHLDQLEVIQFAAAPRLAFNTLHPMPLLYQSHAVPGPVKHFHMDACFGFVAHGDPRDAIASDESPLEWFTEGEVSAFEEQQIPGDMRAMALYLLRNPDAHVRMATSHFTLAEPPVFR